MDRVTLDRTSYSRPLKDCHPHGVLRAATVLDVGGRRLRFNSDAGAGRGGIAIESLVYAFEQLQKWDERHQMSVRVRDCAAWHIAPMSACVVRHDLESDAQYLASPTPGTTKMTLVLRA